MKIKPIFDRPFCRIFAGGNIFEKHYELQVANCTIAADSGYDLCKNFSQNPELLIGDLDSISAESLIEVSCEQIKLSQDKDDTDTMAAVKYAVSKGYKYFEIYGALGNDIAHSLANIQTLNFLDEHGAQGVIICDNTLIFLLSSHNRSIEINKDYHAYFEPSTKISLLAFTPYVGGITTNGMKWTLNNAKLDASFPLGVSNKIDFNTYKSAKISITEGKLLVICGESF